MSQNYHFKIEEIKLENKFNCFKDYDKKQEENYFRCDDFIEENFLRAEEFRFYALQSFHTCKEKCKDIKVQKHKNRFIERYKSINI